MTAKDDGEGGRKASRLPRGPSAWRDAPRDDDAALKPFPQKAGFIAHLRATGRPTTKDLRKLRALKKTPAKPDPSPE